MIDPVTFEPELENVINNFMNCTQMLFGSKVKYGITFKTNQKSFKLWSKAYKHDFSSTVVTANLSGSIGIPLETMNAFCVSHGDEVRFYSLKDYQEMKETLLKIPLLRSETREPNQILAMVASANE